MEACNFFLIATVVCLAVIQILGHWFCIRQLLRCRTEKSKLAVLNRMLEVQVEAYQAQRFEMKKLYG